MNYDLPAGAVPLAEPAVVELVSSILPELDVSTPRQGAGLSSLPMIRLTPVYNRRASESWERSPVFQVDVWADDEGAAGDIAVYLAHFWDRIMRVDLTTGGYVSAAWVETDPRLMPSANETDPARYFIQVGFLLHPERPE